ncbi:MAG: hypothetical protein K2X82_23090 [Gemmataceae bacterium]|nr:hypothetical protein [Gemmataceae bacterium]
MSAVVPYEQRLGADFGWALREGSLHFEERSAVFRTVRGIARQLDGIGVRYAIAGAVAMFLHGYRRFTEDVNVLVTADGLERLQELLIGSVYVRSAVGGRDLRDAETGVRIEFLVAGECPGHRRSEPVAFPDPEEVAVEVGGVACLSLPALVELKLAAASPRRLKHAADVQEMIRVLALRLDLADQLDPSVRDLYRELWRELQVAPADESGRRNSHET